MVGLTQVKGKTPVRRPAMLFGTIVGDIHFWIPLLVLIGGVLFLHALR